MSATGRFPTTTLGPQFQGPHRFNLSESTTRDLTLGELIDRFGLDAVRAIQLDYSDPAAGSSTLREEIGKRNGIGADHIITTQGAAFALYLVAAELEQIADKAVIAAPYFQQSYNTLQAFGWQTVVVENQFDQQYQLNLDAIDAALNKNVGLISLASPQNPSGVSIPLDTIKQLLTQMEKKAPNAYLLLDETYREAAYTADAVIPSAASLSNKVLTCSSASKAYGVPGLRSGWLTVPNSTLYDRIIAAKLNTVITNSSLAEQLTTMLLQRADPILTDQRTNMRTGLEIVTKWQATVNDYVNWAPPDAGALCCMRLTTEKFPDGPSLNAFWHALADLETFVRPGLLFGSDLRHFRLGFGHVPRDILKQGLTNIGIALQKSNR